MEFGQTKLSQGFGAPLQNVNNVFQQNMQTFGDRKFVTGDKNFLESNSLVAKFSFLLLIIILFILVLRLGTWLLSYFFLPKDNPILVNGLIEGTEARVYQQDPSLTGAIPIQKSVNEADGIEFTWATWLHIKSSNYITKEGTTKASNALKHVFSKGKNTLCNSSVCEPGSMYPNNAPGVYLDANTNKLVIKMNVFSADPNQSIIETIPINDIPMNKWILLVIRVEGNKLDIYVNGTIVKRHILSGVPRQNYDNVYVAQNGGFDGMLSNLRYFNHAISSMEIKDLTSQGPNMKAASGLGKYTPYLSLNWYLNSYQN